MMEIQVNEIKSLEPIRFNYEELKNQLTEKVSLYKSLVYTEENLASAKKDRANLNKLSKAINDEKIRIKNLLLEPYIDFETKCKELIGIVNDATQNIDIQIKAFEEAEDKQKESDIENYFIRIIGEYAGLIKLDSIFNKSWLNKTYALKKVQQDIDHIIAKTTADMSVLDTQIHNEEIKKQAKSYYFAHVGDASVLSNALLEVSKIEETNKKIEELEKREEPQPEVQQQTQSQLQENQNNEDAISIQEKIEIIDFRVSATRTQILELREFLKARNIKYGPVPSCNM